MVVSQAACIEHWRSNGPKLGLQRQDLGPVPRHFWLTVNPSLISDLEARRSPLNASEGYSGMCILRTGMLLRYELDRNGGQRFISILVNRIHQSSISYYTEIVSCLKYRLQYYGPAHAPAGNPQAD
jgi:hypothetical protein